MAQIDYHLNKKHLTKWIIGGLILSFLLIASSIFFMLYPFASKEKKDFFHGDHPILFNGRQAGNAMMEGNTLFVPLTFLQQNIDKHIVYDEQSKSVIITTTDKVVQMPTNSLTIFENQKAMKLQLSPIISENGEILVAIDPILSYYPIDCKIMPGSGVIWIQENGEKYVNGKVISKDINVQKLRLRTEPTLQSPYTAQLHQQEEVMIEGEKSGYYLVRNKMGISGYVNKAYIQEKNSVKINITRPTKPFHMPKINGHVQLTWEAVYTKSPNTNGIANMPGVNVVAPTWFNLAATDGTIKNLASLQYSKWAHSRGYQVWGVFTNSFNPTLTHLALQSFASRQAIIRQLLAYSQMYQLQGINFDIENVNKEDGPLVTQLIREAAPYLHQAGLVLSVDITFEAGDNNNWSSFLDRKSLAQTADYLIVMAYDEHLDAATGEGSVASFPWVETNLKRLLTVVPKQKLVLGVPMYSRLWKEQVNPDGTKTLTSRALTMDGEQKWLTEKGVKPTYDKKTGQFFAQYYSPNENATYKIWLEDEYSLKKRASLAEKYQLAGIGSWTRYFGDSAAWTALNINTGKMVTKR